MNEALREVVKRGLAEVVDRLDVDENLALLQLAARLVDRQRYIPTVPGPETLQ